MAMQSLEERLQSRQVTKSKEHERIATEVSLEKRLALRSAKRNQPKQPTESFYEKYGIGPAIGATAKFLEQPLSKTLVGKTFSEAAEEIIPEKDISGFWSQQYDLFRRTVHIGAGFADWIQTPEGLAVTAAAAATSASGGTASPVMSWLLTAQFTNDSARQAIEAAKDIRANGLSPENTEAFLMGLSVASFATAGGLSSLKPPKPKGMIKATPPSKEVAAAYRKRAESIAKAQETADATIQAAPRKTAYAGPGAQIKAGPWADVVPILEGQPREAYDIRAEETRQALDRERKQARETGEIAREQELRVVDRRAASGLPVEEITPAPSRAPEFDFERVPTTVEPEILPAPKARGFLDFEAAAPTEIVKSEAIHPLDRFKNDLDRLHDNVARLKDPQTLNEAQLKGHLTSIRDVVSQRAPEAMDAVNRAESALASGDIESFYKNSEQAITAVHKEYSHQLGVYLMKANATGAAEIRFPMKGQQPRLSSRPTSVAATSKDVLIRKSDILRELSGRLDIPLRKGRFRERALGIFKLKPEVVRTKIANDVAVASHEFGHAINKIMYGTQAHPEGGITLNWSAFAPYTSELSEIATKPRKGQSPIAEGFAEFIRLYLTDPSTAKTKAPSFTQFFESELNAFPELQSTLRDTQTNIGRWINQPPVARVLSSISKKDIQRPRNYWNDFYSSVIDRLEPIRNAVDAMGGNPSEKNAYRAARLFAGWAAKSDHFLNKGTFDPRTNAITGPPLADILKPAEGNLDNLRAYLVARRVVEKSKQGIDTGIDLPDAIDTIRELDSPQFQAISDQLQLYQGSLLRYLESRGNLSQEQVGRIEKLNQEYVPFYRAFENQSGETLVAGGGFGNVSEAVKRMVGGGENIIDPLETIVRNTYALINLAERNNVAKLFVDQAVRTEGGGKFAELVPPKMRPTTIGLERIKSELASAGVNLDDVDLQTLVTLFTPIHEVGGKDNILSVFRDGKREYYQTSPDVYTALHGLDEAGSHVLVKLLSVPAQALRIGATSLSPEFVVRNPLRDAFTAWMQSNYGFKPGLDTVRGVFHALKKDELYWEWKRSGGEHAALVSLDRTHMQQNLKDLLSSPLGYAMRHPIDALRVFSEFGESGTRLGEFERARKAGADPETAALASREVSIDFARRGSKTQAINLIIAFWNAQVQGMDKFARTHREHPMRSVIRGMAGLTLPTLLLYAVNRDNEKYKELPRWRRDLFWNIPTDGTPLAKMTPFMVIPKPFEWGIVYASFPERLFEWIDKRDPAAFDSMLKNFGEAALPGIVPTAAIPPIEAFANRSLFTGRPIVPMHLQRLSKEHQYEYYTSEFSKAAARTFAGIYRKTGVDMRVSPMQLDNALFGYSGGFGKLVADATGPIFRESDVPAAPQKRLSDLPVIRGFTVRYPSSSTESIQIFYNRLSELQTKRNTENADRAGRITGAAPMSASENYEYGVLNAANEHMQALRRREREIVANESASPASKRRDIDALDLEITTIARETLMRLKTEAK